MCLIGFDKIEIFVIFLKKRALGSLAKLASSKKTTGAQLKSWIGLWKSKLKKTYP